MGILTTQVKLKIAQHKDEFLAVAPNNEVDALGNPIYTDSQWVDEFVKRVLIELLRSGDEKIKVGAIQIADFSDIDV